jgi:hypothetical protein
MNGVLVIEAPAMRGMMIFQMRMALIKNGENTVVNLYVDEISKLLMLAMFPVPNIAQ